MERRRWYALMLGVAMAGVTALAGCEACRPRAGAAPPAKTAAPAPAPAARMDDGMVRTSVAYPTGDRNTSMMLIEQATPAQVVTGQTFEHEVTLTNISALALQEVRVANVCAASMDVQATVPPANEKDGELVWDLGTMAAGESKTVKTRGVAREVGALKNCVAVTYDTRTCIATQVVQPALQLAMSVPAEVLKCDPIPVRLTVSNTGSGPAQDVKIDQPLAKGLVTSAGLGAVNAMIGTIQPGQSQTVDVVLKAEQTGAFDHKATASGAMGLKAMASGATTVRAPALAIEQSGPDRVYLGRNVSYTATVTNTGDGVARDTMIEAPIPAAAKVVTVSAGGAVDASRVVWNVGTIAPKDSRKVELTLAAPTAGMLDHPVMARAYCAPAVTAPGKTSVEGIAAILLEVIDIDDPIAIGNNETYMITVTNQGTASDNNIVVACEIEDSMQFVSADGVTAGKADGAKITFGPLARLEPKAKASWRVVVKAIKPADARFTVKVTSDQIERPIMENESTHFYK